MNGSAATRRDAKIFSRSIGATAPLLFKFLPFGGEDFAQPFDSLRNQRVSFVDSIPGIIDESYLNAVPLSAQIAGFVRGE